MKETLPNLLRELTLAVQLHLEQMPALRELGLAPYQARVLRAVGLSPGISQQQLAKATQRDKAQVARAVRQLAERGLLRREAHESDWRAQRLYVTPQAERARAMIEAQRKAVFDNAFSALDSEEQAQLAALLARTLATLRSHSAPGA